MNFKLNMLTLNMTGLKNLIEWKRTINMLRKQAIDVCVSKRLLRKQEEKYLRGIWGEHVYHSSSNAHTKGIALGIHKKVT